MTYLVIIPFFVEIIGVHTLDKSVNWYFQPVKVKEHSCGGICPGRDEQENECQPDCGIYGVWTGSSCKCDHGYMGQCCRKQEDMSAMLEVRILYLDMFHFRRLSIQY